MTESNEKYGLGLDLSDFAPMAPAPESLESYVSAALAETGEKGEDSEYDEDFEDYSEGEEEKDAPKSDLSKSVANLKLTLGAAAGSQLDPVAEEQSQSQLASAAAEALPPGDANMPVSKV